MTRNQDNFEDNARKAIRDNVDLLVRKNKQYGGENILVTGVQGVAVRLMDKVNRALTMTKGANEPEFESLYDTFVDITNYGVIGQMLLKGQWPGQPEDTAQLTLPTPDGGQPWVDGPAPKASSEFELQQLERRLGELRAKYEGDKDWDSRKHCPCLMCREAKSVEEKIDSLKGKDRPAPITREEFGKVIRESMDRVWPLPEFETQREEDESGKGNPEPFDKDHEPGPWKKPDQKGLVYLCGPIDQVSEDDAMDWRLSAALMLQEAGYASFNPAAAVTNGNAARESVQLVCVDALKHSSSVIAYLPSGMPAFGSIVELTLAFLEGKDLVIVSDWVERSVFSESLVVVKTLEEAVEYTTNESYRAMVDHNRLEDYDAVPF